jgi:hypothetical protein
MGVCSAVIPSTQPSKLPLTECLLYSEPLPVTASARPTRSLQDQARRLQRYQHCQNNIMSLDETLITALATNPPTWETHPGRRQKWGYTPLLTTHHNEWLCPNCTIVLHPSSSGSLDEQGVEKLRGDRELALFNLGYHVIRTRNPITQRLELEEIAKSNVIYMTEVPLNYPEAGDLWFRAIDRMDHPRDAHIAEDIETAFFKNPPNTWECLNKMRGSAGSGVCGYNRKSALDPRPTALDEDKLVIPRGIFDLRKLDSDELDEVGISSALTGLVHPDTFFYCPYCCVEMAKEWPGWLEKAGLKKNEYNFMEAIRPEDLTELAHEQSRAKRYIDYMETEILDQRWVSGKPIWLPFEKNRNARMTHFFDGWYCSNNRFGRGTTGDDVLNRLENQPCTYRYGRGFSFEDAEIQEKDKNGEMVKRYRERCVLKDGLMNTMEDIGTIVIG